jgi:hypothetical protein
VSDSADTGSPQPEPADDAPRPSGDFDEFPFSGFDPELVSHTIAAIVIKNTDAEIDALRDALITWRQQYFDGGEATLADVLVERGAMPRYRLPIIERAADYALKRRRDKVFGKRAYRKGLITHAQLEESLAFQKQLFKALHEIKPLERILVEDGYLGEADAKKIWLEFEAHKKQAPPPEPATVDAAIKTAQAGGADFVVDREGKDKADAPPAPPPPDPDDDLPPDEPFDPTPEYERPEYEERHQRNINRNTGALLKHLAGLGPDEADDKKKAQEELDADLDPDSFMEGLLPEGDEMEQIWHHKRKNVSDYISPYDGIVESEDDEEEEEGAEEE